MPPLSPSPLALASLGWLCCSLFLPVVSSPNPIPDTGVQTYKQTPLGCDAHSYLICPTKELGILLTTMALRCPPQCVNVDAALRACPSMCVPLSLSSMTQPIEADKPAIYYPLPPSSKRQPPVLFGNDGAATGGFRAWAVETHASSGPRHELSVLGPGTYATGRTKLVAVIYDVSGTDWLATIAMPDSVIRFFEIGVQKHAGNGKCESQLGQGRAVRVVRGDWSAMCTWRRGSTGEQYLYLFGKGKVVMFLIRAGEEDKSIDVVEVQTFPIPVEAETCAISASGAGFFGAASGILYSFKAAASTSRPTITELAKYNDKITGLDVYYGPDLAELLFLALPESLEILSITNTGVMLTYLLSAGLPPGVTAFKDIAIYQQTSPGFPHGFVFYATKTEHAEGFALSSLSPIFSLGSNIKPNTAYNPQHHQHSSVPHRKCPSLDNCSHSGFCGDSPVSASCACFAGSTGPTCAKITCPHACTSPRHGRCLSPNTCTCTPPWGGADCSTLIVPVQFETETMGGTDGDDPAIWIHPDPRRRDESRIIATVKSKEGEGLAVFTLRGELVQKLVAPKPNNVDVLYAVPVNGEDGKLVDLAVAGCRGDRTLCIFEITFTGTLLPIPGGSQPLPPGFKPYGSCVYHSPHSGSSYAFINSKSSEFLQFEIRVTLLAGAPTISATLVRRFFAGSGGQVEGCVADDDNALLILGEEQLGLWAYPAEPGMLGGGYLIDTVDEGLDADVEGVTLIHGPTPGRGYILVSAQGVSAFNIYQRAPPHAFVMRFALGESVDGQVDGVTATDGMAATGVDFGVEGMGYGVLVVHDDVNEMPDGGVQREMSFKIVGVESVLGDVGVLGEDRVKELLAEVGRGWDPRAGRGAKTRTQGS